MEELEWTTRNLTILRKGIRKALRGHKLDMSPFTQEKVRTVEDYSELERGVPCCLMRACHTIHGLEAIKSDFFKEKGKLILIYAIYSKRIFPFLGSEEWDYLFGERNFDDLHFFIGRVNKVLKYIESRLDTM